MNWIVCVDRDEEGRAIHCLEQWLSTGGARHGVGYGIPHSYIHCIPLNANLITYMIHGISWSGIPNSPKNSACVTEQNWKLPTDADINVGVYGLRDRISRIDTRHAQNFSSSPQRPEWLYSPPSLSSGHRQLLPTANWSGCEAVTSI
jgi:hypothetical protein